MKISSEKIRNYRIISLIGFYYVIYPPQKNEAKIYTFIFYYLNTSDI